MGSLRYPMMSPLALAFGAFFSAAVVQVVYELQNPALLGHSPATTALLALSMAFLVQSAL